MKTIKVPAEKRMRPKGKARRISHNALFSPQLMPPSSHREMLTWAAKEGACACPDAINFIQATWSLSSEQGLQAGHYGCDPYFTSYPGNLK